MAHVVLNIDAVGKAISGDEEYTPTPSAIVSWLMPTFSPELLVGRVFEIPESYDARVRDQMVTMYYFEHLDVRGSRIEFIDRDGALFHIRWTGTMEDNCASDDPRPNPSVEIIADFAARLESESLLDR